MPARKEPATSSPRLTSPCSSTAHSVPCVPSKCFRAIRPLECGGRRGIRTPGGVKAGRQAFAYDFLISLDRNKRSCRTLATARGFLLFTAHDTLQPLWRRVSCLDQLAGNEARHKTVSLSVWRVVIHENVISVLASFWKASH